MRVRPLRDEADVRALTVAHGRAWRAAYDGVLPAGVVDRVAIGPPDDERVATEYRRLTRDADRRVFVVEDDGGTVRGYAVYRWVADDTEAAAGAAEATLEELYVDPAYWNRGFGTALLEAGLEHVPDRVEVLTLEVLEGNDVGIGFYEERGFEHAGASTFEVGGRAFPTRVYRRPLGRARPGPSETKR